MNWISFKRSSTNCTSCARLFIAPLCGLFLLCSGLAAKGDITNDVSTIADILSAYASGDIGFWTYPRSTGGLNLSRYLWTALFESSGNDGSPTQRASLIRQIRDELRLLSTNRVDASNLDLILQSLNTSLSSIDDLAYNLLRLQTIDANLSSVAGSTSATYSQLSSLASFLSCFDHDTGTGADWNVWLDDSQFVQLLAALDSMSNGVSSAVSSGSQEQLDSLADLLSAIGEANSFLSLIHYDDFDYSGTDRSVRADFETLFSALSNQVAHSSASSYTQLVDEVSTAYEDDLTVSDPTNSVDWVNIPERIEELSDTSDLEQAAEDGGDTLFVKLNSLSASIPPGDAEIVVIPEFTVGGIHVREYRASLDTSITSVAHAVMVFIWYVMLFVALFRLGEGEFAFYASLGRNWSMSGGFHQKGD